MPYEVYMLRGGKNFDKVYFGVTNKGVDVRLREHNGLSPVRGAKETEKWRPWYVYAVVKGTAIYPLGKMDALALEHALQQPRTPLGHLKPRRYFKGLRHYDHVFKAVLKCTKPHPRGLFSSNFGFRERMLELVLSVDYFAKLALRLQYSVIVVGDTGIDGFYMDSTDES